MSGGPTVQPRRARHLSTKARSPPIDASAHREAQTFDKSNEPDAAVLSNLGGDALSCRVWQSVQQYSVTPWLLDIGTDLGIEKLLVEHSWSSLKDSFKSGTASGELRGMAITMSMATFSTDLRSA